MRKSSALCIANERVGSDHNYGKATYENAIVIDLVKSSRRALYG